MSSNAGTLTLPPVGARRNPWRNPKLLVIAAVLLLTVGFLVYNALGSSMKYFVTVGELQASGKDLTGQELRVGGNVEAGTIQHDGFGGDLHFMLTDGTHAIPVTYSGTVPDIFSEQVEVVAEGKIGPDGTLVASQLLTKCPSRFTASDSANAGS
jgi:cytochrome c-type biogenesis protein CcmE